MRSGISSVRSEHETYSLPIAGFELTSVPNDLSPERVSAMVGAAPQLGMGAWRRVRQDYINRGLLELGAAFEHGCVLPHGAGKFLFRPFRKAADPRHVLMVRLDWGEMFRVVPDAEG